MTDPKPRANLPAYSLVVACPLFTVALESDDRDLVRGFLATLQDSLGEVPTDSAPRCPSHSEGIAGNAGGHPEAPANRGGHLTPVAAASHRSCVAEERAASVALLCSTVAEVGGERTASARNWIAMMGFALDTSAASVAGKLRFLCGQVAHLEFTRVETGVYRITDTTITLAECPVRSFLDAEGGSVAGEAEDWAEWLDIPEHQVAQALTVACEADPDMSLERIGETAEWKVEVSA